MIWFIEKWGGTLRNQNERFGRSTEFVENWREID